MTDLVALLKDSRADAWELTISKITGWEFYFIRHDLDQNRIRNVEHIDITVYRRAEEGKMLGKASAEIYPTNTEEEIRKVIDTLCDRAFYAQNKVYTLNPVRDIPSPLTENITLKDMARSYIQTLRSVRETETEFINSYEIFTNLVTRRYVNSEGIDFTETYPESMTEVIVNARNAEHEIELYRMYQGGTCDTDGIREDIEKTMQYGKDRLFAKDTPISKKIPVVFSTDAAVKIYRYFVRNLDTANIVRNMIDWRVGSMISDDVHGDKLTIRAVQHLDNSSENHVVDEEGAVVHDITLIDQNIVKGYWGSRMFNAYMHLDDVFNVTNIVATGGTHSEEEIRSGEYLEIVEFSDFTVSKVAGDIFGEIRLGYYHHEGEIEIVKGGSVSGNMHDLVKDMYCSEKSHQYNNYKIPALTRLENVTVTGCVEK